jgi:hypothetical protein
MLCQFLGPISRATSPSFTCDPNVPMCRKCNHETESITEFFFPPELISNKKPEHHFNDARAGGRTKKWIQRDALRSS